MTKLEVFFDYACPFCLKGHHSLLELLPMFPHIEVLWRPCEAHPRPERYGPHSDLCIQGMFFAVDQGVDLWAYQELMYDLALNRRVDIEDIGTLAAHVTGLLDADDFRDALASGRYRDIQREANTYAYEQSGVWAVPAYRMNGRRLNSVEGVGVTAVQLRAFLTSPPLFEVCGSINPDIYF